MDDCLLDEWLSVGWMIDGPNGALLQGETCEDIEILSAFSYLTNTDIYLP